MPNYKHILFNFGIIIFGFVPNPIFLYSAIQIQTAFILLNAEGGVFPNFNKDQLMDLAIPEPPPEEQKRIVAELELLKEKIEKLSKFQEDVESELSSFTPALLSKALRGVL